ncbi:MAG: hypothetical protein RMA76_19660 [Deltaproteobacteria bacterium]
MQLKTLLVVVSLGAACQPLRYPVDDPDAGPLDASTQRDAGDVRDAAVPDAGGVEHSVTVLLQGAGAGRVEASDVAFNCTSSQCVATVIAGATLELRAVTDQDSAFVSWSSGPCDGEEDEICAFVVDGDIAFAVQFEPVFDLVVTIAGDGAGVVSTIDSVIECPGTCVASILAGSTVELEATPDNGVMFGGWGGDCSGIAPTCSVVMDRDRATVASFDRDRVTLSVTLAGDGSGEVTSDVGAIDCPGTCAESYPLGTTVTLTARSDSDVEFIGWSGACSGTAPCTVAMNTASSVTATFDLNREPLTVTLQGSGAGNVTSDVGTIDCPGICSHDYPLGTSVMLAATPDAASRFVGWGGACSGGSPQCAVDVTGPTDVTAEFVATRTLQIVKVGSGDGVVSSQPAGIDCGATCTTGFDDGAMVTLSAVPDANSYFVEWTGACSGASTCSVSMTSARSVTARFRARALQVAAGTAHACAVFADGSVRCWGRGTNGRLGYAAVDDIGDDPLDDLSVMQVSLGGGAERVALGGTFSCALLLGGSVRCWGDPLYGHLGYGSNTQIGDDEHPASVGPVSLGATATTIVAGFDHTCVLLAGSSVRCWGRNLFGQLGLGTSGVAADLGDNELPTTVSVVSVGGMVDQIACGAAHSCARLTNGAVRCWGDNNRGQLGQGDTERIGDDELPSAAPAIALGGTSPLSIYAGPEATHSCAIFPPASTYRCWGRGTEGQLAPSISVNIGDNELPTAMALTGGQYAQLCASTTHSCARTMAGQVFCWGSNDYGEGTPVLGGSGDLGAPAVDIACGSQFNCAVLATGGVRCWGRGHQGQLGYGDTQNVSGQASIVAVGDVPL